MNIRTAVGVALAVVIVGAVGFGAILVLLGGIGMPVSYTSHYQYEGTIATNDTLTNVTIYLPVSVQDGVPLVDATDVTVTTEDGDANWQVELIDTEQGPMLALTADRVEGELYYLVHEFAENGSHIGWEKVPEDELPSDMTNKKAYPEPTFYRFSVYIPVNERIDVVTPVSNASVFRPIGDLNDGGCEPYWEDDENAACATFETPAYVAYDTGSDNVVHLSLELRGANEWGYGLSNSFNEFVQEVQGDLSGAQDGWITLDGRLYTGVGDETR